jgi:hypothetical protein
MKDNLESESEGSLEKPEKKVFRTYFGVCVWGGGGGDEIRPTFNAKTRKIRQVIATSLHR